VGQNYGSQRGLGLRGDFQGYITVREEDEKAPLPLIRKNKFAIGRKLVLIAM
jgi:hypothetical protein